jgi:hypothetical protein
MGGERPGAQPLDLAIAPGGNIVVSSEHPFGAADAVTTVREYDVAGGRLVRVLTPTDGVRFQKPRGLRFGPHSRLYCVAQDEVVAFDFETAWPQRSGGDPVSLSRPARRRRTMKPDAASTSVPLDHFSPEKWLYKPRFQAPFGPLSGHKGWLPPHPLSAVERNVKRGKVGSSSLASKPPFRATCADATRRSLRASRWPPQGQRKAADDSAGCLITSPSSVKAFLTRTMRGRTPPKSPRWCNAGSRLNDP